MEIPSKFNFGDLAEDTVSGFRGIVYSISLFMHGCTRIGLAPKVGKDGKRGESEYFDEPQLKLIKRAAVAAPKEPKKAGARPGGPMPSIPTQNTPQARR